MATRKVPQASEAPFDRLGAQVLTDPQLALWPLTGARASIYTIAHLGLGEWRLWRGIAEANELNDPLDLEGAELVVPADGAPNAAPFDFPGIPDAAAAVLVDLAAQDQLGVGPVVVSASRELLGVVVLRVEDAAWGVYELSLRGPGSDDFGPPVTITDADFEGVAPSETALVQRVLHSAEGQALSVRLSLDAWLLVWLARYWPLTLEADLTSARASLVLPLAGTDFEGVTL